MESKLSNGFKMNIVVLSLLNYDLDQIRYLTVQLIHPKHVFCTGVVVSQFVILVTGLSILKYEEEPKCGGVQVKFNGALYSIVKCQSHFVVEGNPDEVASDRFYNDIAIAVVRCFKFQKISQ